ncbi:MAG: SDR family oxidoreductase [Zymomonas mobilis]|uniref:SDR family oxidoreductase n=1 Tax=Zymomonas mobilis TaxID=542 RepID=UPI0039ECA74C
MANKSNISEGRRNMMAVLATAGLVSGLDGVASAANRDKEPAVTGGKTFYDPRDAYPRAPFAGQDQPWPGLASKMVPRPDHGEKSYRGSGKLQGRKALITGGDSGIGRATTIAYAREGADIVINYLPQEEPDAREVVALLQGEGHKVFALPGDLRNENFCVQLVQEASKRLGGLDILANIAGHQHYNESILTLSTADFDDTLKTNVYAMFWLCKEALKIMPAGSAIVNTSSTQGYRPSAILLDYATSKAAIANFTRALAIQLAPRGIRVNAVAPGPFWTPLQVSGGQPASAYSQFGANTPVKRPGQPVEIAPVYVFLACAENSYVTGEVYGETGCAQIF